jgi:arylsulfatase A-like enzyme
MAGHLRRARWLALAAAVAGLGIFWCWPSYRPNVLLITVNSLRPDYLSCYGGAHGETPYIDALANAGVLFTHAVCDVPWTRASMASVMTGRYATRHGLRLPYQRLPDGSVTMAEAFATAGYRTGAVVGVFDLDHIFRLDRGFDTYDDRFDAPVPLVSGVRRLHTESIFYGTLEDDRKLERRKLRSDGMRGDAQNTDAAIAWLRRAGARPFFLWVHYFGAHERWREGADLTGVIGMITAQYGPSVLRVDAEVGRLVQAVVDLGFARNTLIVLHADHGQSLLEHGQLGAGKDLYESSLRVPLIMWEAGRLPAGRRVDALVRLIDVFPTVATLAGIPVPPGLDGQSLVGLMEGMVERSAGGSYCETALAATAAASQEVTDPDGHLLRIGFVRRGMRMERWKYIRNEPSSLIDVESAPAIPEAVHWGLMREELYDLQNDPTEQRNVIAENPAIADELLRRIEELHAPLTSYSPPVP